MSTLEALSLFCESVFVLDGVLCTLLLIDFVNFVRILVQLSGGFGYGIVKLQANKRSKCSCNL